MLNTKGTSKETTHNRGYYKNKRLPDKTVGIFNIGHVSQKRLDVKMA